MEKNVTIEEIVKEAVDELDYWALLELGAPRDEYDSETRKIAEQIKPDSTVYEIKEIMDSIFSKSDMGYKADEADVIKCAAEIRTTMDNWELMKARHSVRQYEYKPIDDMIKEALRQEIDACNKEGGLHIQLVTGEPKAFDSFMAHYGKFSGITDYLALVGKKGPQLDEMCGYYGERIVLKAQELGLNTCWVALTYKKVKKAFKIEKGEKLCIVISIGYGKNQGIPHKSKKFDDVAKAVGEASSWFLSGVEAALLAPTAINQQKFFLTQDGRTVTAKAKKGPYSKIDLGIVKYHFELGAGRQNFDWG